MAWEQLSVNKPHLVYIILGGFTSLFMLCSSVIKERLYIGEATVATICGIIFGPRAANLIDPTTWGNVDQVTLEFSRIVLVVQCFAVGVELPKAYMERHWKSVFMLLVPVMTFGWLITSLFIWWLFGSHLNWLDSLCVAACVTATDPVLASSVVGKGKFARRVPKHLRDILSAESGCNDGMAFPFLYLAVYLIRYHPDATLVFKHWFCYTVLYECAFGCFYGVMVGYAARRAIRLAHEKDLIDRESFLVFYFVLALFCAGSGSLLGMDDLLIGFACGVGFSNDGWFLEKTEESHVSNVIDLLINLAFFVYFGTIIPWNQFSASVIGISPWRLVVLGLLVVLFRRIPIMLACKPIVPDIKTWREALFAGHFGPIGVGALFVAILARAELETETTTPLAELPEPGFKHMNIIETIWPITCFLVIVSIVIHGSSVAVFTLGKHINTLTLTLSYTTGRDDDGPTWMDRLPRIQSRSKSSMSLRRREETDNSSLGLEEKSLEYNGDDLGTITPSGLPRGFLRRQKDDEEAAGSRSGSLKPKRRKKNWDAGGPITQSAITPVSATQENQEASPSMPVGQDEESEPERRKGKDRESASAEGKTEAEAQGEVYFEGEDVVIEDEEGNVLGVIKIPDGETDEQRVREAKEEGRRLIKEKGVEHGVSKTEHEDDHHLPGDGGGTENPKDAPEHPNKWGNAMKKMQSYRAFAKAGEEPGPLSKPKEPEKKRGPALAYQYGNTIIVEDEDGEVLKKYDIPNPQRPHRPGGGLERRPSMMGDSPKTRERMNRMGSMFGLPRKHGHADEGAHAEGVAGPSNAGDESGRDVQQADDGLRFTMTAGGRRMGTAEFIQQMRRLDPKSRVNFVEDSDAPEPVKRQARRDAKGPASAAGLTRNISRQKVVSPVEEEKELNEGDDDGSGPTTDEDVQDRMRGRERLRARRTDTSESTDLTRSANLDVPHHSVADDLARFAFGRDTAAQRRRVKLEQQSQQSQHGRKQGGGSGTGAAGRSSDDDGFVGIERSEGAAVSATHHSKLEEAETEIEKRRRLGALGIREGDSDSESGGEREREQGQEEEQARPGVRFVEQTKPAGAGSGSGNIRRPGPLSQAGSSVGGGGGGGVAERLGRLKIKVGRKG